MLLSSFVGTLISPTQHFAHIFEEDGEFMLFQILPDFLPCLYYLIPQNHSVIREVKLKHLQLFSWMEQIPSVLKLR